jgi:cobalt/nickel transport system ATP-binding protein
MNPEVMILDEPTAGLDPVYTTQIMEMLNELNKKGTTVIISSHNMEEVYAWADYVFVLSQGEIVSQGIPEELFRNEEILVKGNLKKPWVLELFDNLVQKGLIKNIDIIPRTREQLLKLL